MKTEKANEYIAEYAKLKENIITEIYWYIRNQQDDCKSTVLDISEIKGCPAIVTQVINDQESEVIHDLVVNGSNVIAKAGVYEDDVEYNLDDFEVPMLLQILTSVEKHLELEG